MITIEVLQASVNSYKSQYDQLNSQLAEADRVYQQQRDQTVRALLQLEGAMIGLQQLIDNPPVPVAALKDANVQGVVQGVIDEQQVSDDGPSGS